MGFGRHQGHLGCQKSEEMDLELQRNWYAVEVHNNSVVIWIDTFERKGITLCEGIDLGGLAVT